MIVLDHVSVTYGVVARQIKAVNDVSFRVKEGEAFGFTGTPGFLVNGVSLQGAYPLEAFVRLIDRQLAARAVSTRAH